jgi:hypothetical protein
MDETKLKIISTVSVVTVQHEAEHKEAEQKEEPP